MVATGDSFVRMAGVRKSYDGRSLAVRHLDLDIARGEFFTLLGPSGSGKTAVLMMLAGFERPTDGQIWIGGTEVSALPAWQRGIGMVFQSQALFPHLSVAENLAFPLQVRKLGRDEIRSRVNKFLAKVRLREFADHRPSQLSGGQRQRVALARALVFEPPLVLMDEPLGGLDKHLREGLQSEIKLLREQLGLTIIQVTHDQSEALVMSDRVAIMHQGAIQQVGTPTEIYEQPANSFVASFIGASNHLRGRVIERIADECTVEVHGRVVRAVAVNCGGGGSDTTLAIRPERVVLEPTDSNNENLIGARVEELTFHGDHLQARLSVLGTSDFVVKLPTGAGYDGLQPAQPVRIGWQVRDCRALDAGMARQPAQRTPP